MPFREQKLEIIVNFVANNRNRKGESPLAISSALTNSRHSKISGNTVYEAGRLMLKRIGELLSAGVSFSVETTLSTRSYINLIQQAQNQGYSVSLIYFWLNSPELAIERVKQRVANGGHDVPAPIIRRRYRSGLENFFRIYMPCVDYWMLADNSCTPRVIVADAFRLGDEVHIYNQELFTKIRSYVN